MWNDENNSINNIIFKIYSKDYTNPSICPICGKNSCHFYMTRFGENDEHGSGWIWCSDCHNFTHFQYRIPKWWINCPVIDLSKLQSDPDYLENNKNIIDQWVNDIFNKNNNDY